MIDATRSRPGRRVLLAATVVVGLTLALATARSSDAAAFRIATGAYIPGVEEDPGVIDAYAEKVGRAPVIVSLYRNWEQAPVEPDHLDPIADRGSVPMITWEPWDDSDDGVGLWSIAAGEHDDYLTSAAQGAADWGQPLFLRFAHEMNGSWYPWGWGVDGNTPAAYKAAWRHVVDVFRANGAANVRWVWCPYVSNVRPRQFARFYPGDQWVDWACLDGFNWGAYRSWQSFKTIFAAPYQRLIRVTSRPVMIGETGVNQTGGNKSRWISRSLRHHLPRYSHVRALVWWSVHDPRGDFRVDSSDGALSAIRVAFRRPVFSADRDVLLGTPARLRAERPRHRSRHPKRGHSLPGKR